METIAITSNTVPQEIPLSLLMESTTNPRQHFEENALNELAETIRKSGVFQAILARPKDERWRSSSERGGFALRYWQGRTPFPRWFVR